MVAMVAVALLAVPGRAQTVVLTSDPPGETILFCGSVEVGRTPTELFRERRIRFTATP
jgi:hypothetical protein